MKRTEPNSWRQVKAKIIVRFGTVGAVAREIGCSEQAIRQTVLGKCPRVAAQLKELLAA